MPDVELESSAPRGNTYTFTISPVCGLLKLRCVFFPLQRPSPRLLPALLLSFFTFCCGDSVHLAFRFLLGRVLPSEPPGESVLQARLQQYVNCELPDVQAGFRKGRGTRDQIANICWITDKAREFQKNIYFCFIDYAKAFDCVDHNKLWKILKEMGVSDHLASLLRNLYAGQEATVRTGHGTTDWFQIGKGVHQGCILSPCLFNFYAEYIMQNTRLDEAQAGSKIT